MRAQDVEAALERIGAQVHEDEGLAVRVRPDLVACLQVTAVLDELVERDIAGVFGLLDGGSGDLALDLVIGYEVDVACGKLVYLGELVVRIGFPGILVFHALPPRSAFVETLTARYTSTRAFARPVSQPF